LLFEQQLISAQVAQGQTKLPQTNESQPQTTDTAHPETYLTEPKQMMEHLLDQMGTLINLINSAYQQKVCNLERQWLVPICARDKAIPTDLPPRHTTGIRNTLH